MKKRIVLYFLLFGFVLMAKAQQLNNQFPIGQYTGKPGKGSFIESKDLVLNVIDEQQVCLTFRINFSFDNEEKEAPLIEYMLKYVLRNDTLYFEPYDDSVPYLVYYTPEDIVSATDGDIRVQVETSTMFETYEVKIHSLKGEKTDTKVYDENAYLFDEGVVNINYKASTGDTLWVSTSMGEYGFQIPANVKSLYLTPNKPNLGFEYIYKGESVNELILKAGPYDNEIVFFYKGNIPPNDLAKLNDEQTLSGNKTFIQASKHIPPTLLNISAYEDDKYSYTDEDESYLLKKDTILYTYSYKEAVKIAKESNLFIRVLYMKENLCLDKYLERIRELNKDGYYYDNEYTQLRNCILVFLNEKDEKQVQRLGITKPNTDFFLSSDEILLHQKKIICSDDYYSVTFFSSDEKYLVEELNFMYLEKVLVPELEKNPNNVTVLKQYLDKINHITQTIDYFSYNDPWSTYISNRSYYFNHIDTEEMPSSRRIISYLNNYTKAKMDAPFDTSLVKMIFKFYNIICGSKPDATLSSYPVKYLIKHSGALDGLQVNEVYTYRTVYQIIFNILTDPVSNGEGMYTQDEVLDIYREAITLLPEYADYLYLLSYQVFDLSAVSPGFYKRLLAFYKDYLLKVQNINDWDNYLLSLKEQIDVFESGHRNYNVRDPERLYKMLPHLAWIIGIHEGREGENIALASQCARIASERSESYYDNRYIVPNYVAFLYFIGQTDQAISVQKAYCTDRADSYSEYDQKMMYNLKEMILGLYEPMIVINR